MGLTDFQQQNGGAAAFQFGDGSGFNASGQVIPTRYTAPTAANNNNGMGIPGPSTPTPQFTTYPAGTTPPAAATSTATAAPTLQPVDENTIRENVRQGMQASITCLQGVEGIATLNAKGAPARAKSPSHDFKKSTPK